jgi:hypothetical protein
MKYLFKDLMKLESKGEPAQQQDALEEWILI